MVQDWGFDVSTALGHSVVLPRIKSCGDTVADCNVARWVSSHVVQPFRAPSEREQDALKGWTTYEDLPNDRRGISPFPQILERVSIELTTLAHRGSICGFHYRRHW